MSCIVVSCKTQQNQFELNQIQGLWSTVESNVGYLEFYVKDSSMLVCSDEYGVVYSGKVEVKNDSLIQYNSDNESIKISGKIAKIDSAYMLLIYRGVVRENCYKIKDTLSQLDFVNEKYCFKGFEERKKASTK